jgi:hypothetical protein
MGRPAFECISNAASRPAAHEHELAPCELCSVSLFITLMFAQSSRGGQIVLNGEIIERREGVMYGFSTRILFSHILSNGNAFVFVHYCQQQ